MTALPDATILVGDVRQRLTQIPDCSVQCCVTSPPYWGLRDYGHDGQIGLEQTPEQYVAEMVDVFREVRRVLADDGVLWLNLGDSYAANRSYQVVDKKHVDVGNHMAATVPPGLKPKDLVGIPWRVAFALQADGWWLRQDIIWHKPNVMPEAVKDRCTKCHEYLFMFTKSKSYQYDNQAILEPVSEVSIKRAQHGWKTDRPSAKLGTTGIDTEKMGIRFVNPKGRNKRSVWTIPPARFKGAHFAVMPEALVEPCVLATSRPGDTVLDPFTGSGTVAVVALRHGRSFVGTELNTEYADIAVDRITTAAGMFGTVTLKKD